MSLFGHDAHVTALIEAAAADRLHHAWLLAGPEGIGKAAFADAAAARLLADAAGPRVHAAGLTLPEDHPTARLIAAGSHPDLMRLERLVAEKTGDRARNIAIDQVRGLSRLFGTSGSFSARRVVVIDAVDDLEPEGANALLKNLEEPPTGALFLLVSHAPGRLLPTIRSRCRTLRFQPLDDEAMDAALAVAGVERDARAALIAVGEGSPGRALSFAGLDVAGLDAAIDGLMREGDPDNRRRMALARSLATKAAAARYALLLQRVPIRIARHARGATGDALATAIEAWARARDLSAAAPRLSLDPQTTIVELAGIAASLAAGRAHASR